MSRTARRFGSRRFGYTPPMIRNFRGSSLLPRGDLSIFSPDGRGKAGAVFRPQFWQLRSRMLTATTVWLSAIAAVGCLSLESRLAEIEVDREGLRAKVKDLPKREELVTPEMNEQLIVELYSR